MAACDFYRDAEGDYSPDAPRTDADRAAARALMAAPDGDDTGAWNCAAQLLDAADVDGFARLLETDHLVRRDVVARMREMSSPAIAELLERDRLAFEAFTTALTDAAHRAGFSVGRRDGDSLQIEDHWWNLESFFHRRNGNDAMRRMITWIDDAARGRDPRARPGHFMAD